MRRFRASRLYEFRRRQRACRLLAYACDHTLYPQRNSFEDCNFHSEAWHYEDSSCNSHWLQIQINHTVSDGYLTIDWSSLVCNDDYIMHRCKRTAPQVSPHDYVPMCKIDERSVRIGQRVGNEPNFWNGGYGPNVFMSFLYPNGSKVLNGKLFNFGMDHRKDCTVWKPRFVIWHVVTAAPCIRTLLTLTAACARKRIAAQIRWKSPRSLSARQCRRHPLHLGLSSSAFRACPSCHALIATSAKWCRHFYL